jgi:hypothetical protein
MGLVVFGLTACGKDSDTTNETATTSGTVVDNQEVAVDDSTTTDGTISFDEYQLNFYLNSTDLSGNQLIMDMDVYQKGDKALYVINKMPETPESPIKTLKTLIIGDVNYVNMEVNGKAMWFKAEGLDATQLDAQLFDLGKMQTELEATADQSKDETIDGKKMTCYYKNDGTEDGKACTYKGVFTYAESKMLDGSDISTIMKVSNFKDNVDDKVFAEPTDAKDMVELMGMLGGE